MSRRSGLGLSILFAALLCSGNGSCVAENISDHAGGATAEVKVMATPEIAYEAIRALREGPSEGCKVLSTCAEESIVEEIFDELPIIGKATCVYRETYEPSKMVRFKMIRSDKLKAFEGEWTLTSVDDGQHTMVKLRSYIDTGLKVPFAKQITQAASTSELKEHVAEVKKAAELKQKRIASGFKNPSL